MNMSSESLLVILLVGLVAGWLAGQIVRGAGFGIIGDVIVGILGAFIGSWLLPQLGIHIGTGVISAIVNATIGAILLLLVFLHGCPLRLSFRSIRNARVVYVPEQRYLCGAATGF